MVASSHHALGWKMTLSVKVPLLRSCKEFAWNSSIAVRKTADDVQVAGDFWWLYLRELFFKGIFYNIYKNP